MGELGTIDVARTRQWNPEFIAEFREVHGEVPPNTVITLDGRLTTTMPYQFVNAAVEWAYRDPTIRLTPYE